MDIGRAADDLQGTYTIHHHERAALLTEMSVNSFLVESYEPKHVLRSRD